MRGRRLRNYRAEVQMVFQDPYSALNPAKTLGYVLGRPLVNYQGLRGAAMREKVLELLETGCADPGQPVRQPLSLRAVRRSAAAGGDRARARGGATS